MAATGDGARRRQAAPIGHADRRRDGKGEARVLKGSARETDKAARRRRSGRAGPPPAFAAIDLGTNNCRLLVARPTRDGLRVIDGFSRIVRLGEGLTASGRLSDQAIERAVSALKVCAEKIQAREVKASRCIATEACRRAGNGGEFLGRVKKETGLQMEAISAAEEAELTLAGCAPLIDAERPRALLFDIGGGSTELMWIATARGGPPKALDILSMPFGVVGLAEEFGGDALPADVFDRIVQRVEAALDPFEARHGIAAAIADGRVQAIGTSGTVTTLGAIYLGLPRYERSKVDGLTMEIDNIRDICRRLVALDFDARHRHPCIGPGRADLMIMGCAILTAICRRWPSRTITAADRGIREGLLLGLMAAHRARA
jgi:exopolyphosphatase/guanosine-5'-triphosphate,3'-diphosphate pyrophosphatase